MKLINVTKWNPYEYAQLTIVSKKVDWKVNIVFSANCGLSGTSRKHCIIHECISAKEKLPLILKTFSGLENFITI